MARKSGRQGARDTNPQPQPQVQPQSWWKRGWFGAGIGLILLVGGYITFDRIEKIIAFWQSLTPDFLVAVKKEDPPNIFDAEFSIENKGTRTMCITKIAVTPRIRTKNDNFLL